jgi:hypothetical protein
MITNKVTFAAVAAMAVVLSAAMLVSSLATPVEAKITQHCRNGGGNEPQGQCNGNGLTVRNENPSGHAPPGHN